MRQIFVKKVIATEEEAKALNQEKRSASASKAQIQREVRAMEKAEKQANLANKWYLSPALHPLAKQAMEEGLITFTERVGAFVSYNKKFKVVLVSTSTASGKEYLYWSVAGGTKEENARFKKRLPPTNTK